MDFDGWEPLGEPIGQGGQGRVWKARNPIAKRRRAELVNQIEIAIKHIPATGMDPQRHTQALVNALPELVSLDDQFSLGALKEFSIPTSAPKEQVEKAIGRLGTEIEALQSIQHPSLIRLLHSNRDKHFIVTEYHRGGTLAGTRRFVGNPRAALEAFRDLVDGVAV